MISIAIVDDEEIIREQVKKLIEKRFTDCKMDTYATGETLLNTGKYYDIVFLDIQMEGINGIDTAKELRQKFEDIVLIFITGVKEYVFDAFDVGAFHYLVKPVEEEKLFKVYERAVVEVAKQRRRKEEPIFIKTRNRNITLEQKDILYVESRGKKVEIHTGTEIVEAYGAIRELQRQLSDSFYRCHRGYLINMAFVLEYSNDSILLKNGETVILAKEKYSDFVKIYMRYLKNGGGIFFLHTSSGDSDYHGEWSTYGFI